MNETDPKERFLSRWSRRKLEESESAAIVPAAEETSAEAGEPVAEEVVSVDDLPDIETLDKDSDFTVFMQAGVPEELRNLALRKLWMSDPVFANLDGLNDYDQDFNAIMQTGAEFMKRLADAGEKIMRPGADDAEGADRELTETAAGAGDTQEMTDTAETTPADEIGTDSSGRSDDSSRS